MPAGPRGGYQLALPRHYLQQSIQDSRANNVTQHGATHYPYPPALTPRDVSPYSVGMGSSSRPNRLVDGAMMGNRQPLYLPNVQAGHPRGPFHDQSPESAYPSQTEIWAELREMSVQIANLVEAEKQRTRVIDARLDTMETRLNAFESALADADGSRAKKAGGGLRGASNKHPMLKVSRL